jgi:hypothetical protein
MITWRKIWRGGAVAGALLLGAALTVAVASPAGAANPPCYVNSDGSFQCGNTAPTRVYERAMFGPQSPTVDILRSNPSWFSCYAGRADGAAWNGSNYFWYWTYGDDTGDWGFVPATMVFTPNDPFVDSSGRHVRHCG